MAHPIWDIAPCRLIPSTLTGAESRRNPSRGRKIFEVRIRLVRKAVGDGRGQYRNLVVLQVTRLQDIDSFRKSLQGVVA